MRSSLRVQAALMLVATLAVASSASAQFSEQPPPPPIQAQFAAQPPPPPGAQVQVVEAPPGYVVVQQPGYGYPNPASAALRAEMLQLEVQIGEYSLAPPIIVTALGGVTMGVSGLMWMVYSLADELSGDYGNDRLGWGIATLAGAALMTGGLIWLFSNVAGRRPYATRRKQIILQLRAMGEQAFERTRPQQTWF